MSLTKGTSFVGQILFAFIVVAVFVTISRGEEAGATDEQSECPKFCTKEYNPVCAAFGDLRKTFPNPCTLKAEQCVSGSSGYTYLHAGKCVDE